ncbi:Trp biosynthesis-associated membrane protein [Luteipulveratus flavus]|uniref:Trp biosynthesis-associated membrane protein n=1 Tax=Luteipulveratus flavus TaxID=3031728 RepID=A0ABT6C6C1_9MICO|nr:Trp biosynthesis-associated membrane protein [Luteipulveratus sp. YIM 133296]MDF8264118.1 Trp biosynthesis-associated membrane protein [Luteipulveratus sp. YIM 133296]
MTSKRNVLLLALLGAVVLLATAGRTWVEGTLHDAVLQDSTVSVDGNDAASGVLAAGLVGAAAAVATATGGRVVRRVGAVATVLAGVLAIVLTVRVLLDPADVVGRQAAQTTGRTGTVPADGTVTTWVWVALLGGVLLAAAGALAFVGIRRWAGLSSRYEAPTGRGHATRVSDWERLSQGEDPTVEPGDAAGDPPR